MILVDVLETSIFSARGGEGRVQGTVGGGGVDLLYWTSQEGGGVPGGGGGRGAGRVSAAPSLGNGGGGAKYFFRGRNVHKVIVVAESLARDTAATRVTSVCWQSHLPPKAETCPYGPCFRCAAIRISAVGIHLCNIRSVWNLRESQLTTFAQRTPKGGQKEGGG